MKDTDMSSIVITATAKTANGMSVFCWNLNMAQSAVHAKFIEATSRDKRTGDMIALDSKSQPKRVTNFRVICHDLDEVMM